ncbi:hypothetical protein GCM10022197_00460 [Microlunatus spumicola]|uniref:PknH-like extracellular domain-containing protein n=1 Tax=Microlunatus spumicola TaxID=81499 RepID=A0ABP6WBI8_9ACTN
MPDHDDGTDTDDLDARFDGLVREVESGTRRPGAQHAIGAARGRRAGLAAAALVVVLALAGGIGGWTRQEQRLAVPVGPPSTTASALPPSPDADSQAPTPQPMTVDGLNQAGAGWVSWTSEDDASATAAPRCLTQATRPVIATSSRFLARTSAEGSLERLRFASRDDANAAMLATVQAFDACPESIGISNHDITADLEVVAFPFGRGDQRGAVWLVAFGDRMDVFHVVGVPPVPDDVSAEVSRVLAADVQVP